MGIISQQKHTQINRENNQENKHRVDYDYIVRDNSMLTNHIAYKYETPYRAPFLITQCLTNGTVNLKYGMAGVRYNIRRIKPYKLDTKVEDFDSKKYV